ncbi:hypothetical protein J1614_003901, partial [Plenodomus biglobosus]
RTCHLTNAYESVEPRLPYAALPTPTTPVSSEGLTSMLDMITQMTNDDSSTQRKERLPMIDQVKDTWESQGHNVEEAMASKKRGRKRKGAAEDAEVLEPKTKVERTNCGRWSLRIEGQDSAGKRHTRCGRRWPLSTQGHSTASTGC